MHKSEIRSPLPVLWRAERATRPVIDTGSIDR